MHFKKSAILFSQCILLAHIIHMFMLIVNTRIKNRFNEEIDDISRGYMTLVPISRSSQTNKHSDTDMVDHSLYDATYNGLMQSLNI
ncbi:hypothetical protein T09_11496 [Trichinella sp. T9]|nr:hypothetical protein T09_12205 [Trichinella sp. T9]KRX67983.1 hypothetical protein T09_11496 [Trichinella sp. T9]